MWGCVLLTILLYICALAVMMGVDDHLVEYGLDGPDSARLLQLFGSVGSTIISLFMAVTGGVDWGESVAPLLRVSVIYLPFFMLFVAVLSFGVLGMLTSVFVEASREASQGDVDDYVHQLEAEEKQREKEVFLRTLFEKWAQDGVLERERFVELLGQCADDVQIRGVLGLDCDNPGHSFNLLPKENYSHVTLEEFIQGIKDITDLKATGQLSVDVANLLKQVKRLFEQNAKQADRTDVITNHLAELADKIKLVHDVGVQQRVLVAQSAETGKLASELATHHKTLLKRSEGWAHDVAQLRESEKQKAIDRLPSSSSKSASKRHSMPAASTSSSLGSRVECAVTSPSNRGHG